MKKELIIPKTKSGKFSLIFIALMPILFIVGSILANSIYSSVPAGNSITEDVAARPVLAISMLLGMASGVSAFFVGLFAIIKNKERSIPVFIAVILGALFLLFLLVELIVPH